MLALATDENPGSKEPGPLFRPENDRGSGRDRSTAKSRSGRGVGLSAYPEGRIASIQFTALACRLGDSALLRFPFAYWPERPSTGLKARCPVQKVATTSRKTFSCIMQTGAMRKRRP